MIKGYIVAGLRAGTIIHLPTDDQTVAVEGWSPEFASVRNLPEDITEDVRTKLEVRGFTFEPVYDDLADPAGAAERDVANWQRQQTSILEQLAIARAISPPTPASAQSQAQLDEELRRVGGRLAGAVARRNALPVPAAVTTL